jgi:hypothetical protein
VRRTRGLDPTRKAGDDAARRTEPAIQILAGECKRDRFYYVWPGRDPSPPMVSQPANTATFVTRVETELRRRRERALGLCPGCDGVVARDDDSMRLRGQIYHIACVPQGAGPDGSQRRQRRTRVNLPKRPVL